MGACCLARDHPRHVTLPLHLPDNVSPHPIHCHPTPYPHLSAHFPLGCQRSRSRHFRITHQHLSRFISPCPHQGLWQSSAVSNHSVGKCWREPHFIFKVAPIQKSRLASTVTAVAVALTLLKCARGIIGGSYVPHLGLILILLSLHRFILDLKKW